MIGKFPGMEIPPEFPRPKGEPGGPAFPPKPRFPEGGTGREGGLDPESYTVIDPEKYRVKKDAPNLSGPLKEQLDNIEAPKTIPEESVVQPQRADTRHCPVENGKWEEGERGDGKWVPEGKHVPGKANPENQTWDEILEEHEIDGVKFKDGEPDFAPVSKGDVEIEEFSTNRSDNFDKADAALAEQRGCKPEDVERWRKENGYTWHEKADMKTMQKVPSKVHNNIPHQGGIAAAKNSGVAA